MKDAAWQSAGRLGKASPADLRIEPFQRLSTLVYVCGVRKRRVSR